MSFKSFWERLRVIDSWSLQKAFPDYHFNPLLWRISILLLVVWLIFAASGSNLDFGNRYYFRCLPESITVCDNPFYQLNPCPDESGVLCQRKFFNQGESFGESPNFFYNNMGFVGALALIVPFFLNHYLYNNKKKANL